MKVIPHVAQNKSRRRSAVVDEIAQSEGYAISQRKPGDGAPHREVDQLFVLTMAAYNLVRMRTLAEVRPLAAWRVRESGKRAPSQRENSNGNGPGTSIQFPECVFGALGTSAAC
ncbi:hypothetical protein FB547_110234 [Variovorax beijingensis]|uniref:Transposase DDE domain-containing protein n=1 Tax=Variovorax beijingensis TaxID=2496117 RepID=A0A561BEV0_9BURK|nr:hypothetical protein FB547_110234 [Variovorax beijingensis]